MEEAMLVQAIVDMGYAALAVAMVFYWLLHLDRRSGAPWTTNAQIIRSEPGATALYFGLRWLGTCILVGLLLGR